MEKNNSVYLYLKQKALDKAIPAAKEEAKGTYGPEAKAEDGESMLVFEENAKLIGDGINFKFDTNTLQINLETKLGDIFIDVKLDQDATIQLIELAVKKLNKFKTILEAMQ